MPATITNDGNLILGPLCELRYEGDLAEKIARADLVTDPYPYFVIDDFFRSNEIAAFHDNWPDFGYFGPDVPKNYTCKTPFYAEELPYWTTFMLERGVTIANAMAKKFAPWIEARYGINTELMAQFAGLMQSEPDYPGHSCHTHHYHNPNWVGTALIYLDEVAAGHPGTTIYRSKCPDIEAEARLAANTLHWLGNPGISEVQEVAYTQNRIFAFFDSPVSYHGVKASVNAHGDRRLMRFHLGVANDWLEDRYGCDIAEFRRMRMEQKDDPIVFEWLKRDIEEFRSVS